MKNFKLEDILQKIEHYPPNFHSNSNHHNFSRKKNISLHQKPFNCITYQNNVNVIYLFST